MHAIMVALRFAGPLLFLSSFVLSYILSGESYENSKNKSFPPNTHRMDSARACGNGDPAQEHPLNGCLSVRCERYLHELACQQNPLANRLDSAGRRYSYILALVHVHGYHH